MTAGTDPLQQNDAAAAAAEAESMKRELDKKNMSLAKAEEKCLVLEARQEDFTYLLQGFREEKVRRYSCVCGGGAVLGYEIACFVDEHSVLPPVLHSFSAAS